MKTFQQLVEENYASFKLTAVRILRGKIPFSDYPPDDLEDLAHRVVSEFFGSHSLSDTYDETKGNIKGYFVSYTMLRVRSLRREWNKASVTLKLEPWMAGVPRAVNVESRYDTFNYYESMLTLLGQRAFKTRKGLIPYKLVLQIMVLQSFQEDEVTYANIKRKLGVNKHLARSMCLKVKGFLYGKRAEGLL